jgi:hypothetical protein
METKVQVPLEDRVVVSRIGGHVACGECGCSLFLQNCLAVCVAKSNIAPKFVYFCNENHAKPYVDKHPDVQVSQDVDLDD